MLAPTPRTLSTHSLRQVIAFLAGLHYGFPEKWDKERHHAYAEPSAKHVSGGLGGAILIVCPVTVIHQVIWVPVVEFFFLYAWRSW